MDEATSSLFSSLLQPYWRESEAQLTEKQMVLLMHDIYDILLKVDGISDDCVALCYIK